MTQSLKELIENFSGLRQQFLAQAQEKFKECFSEFWKMNPSVKAVTWVQYAPYFNDGNPCVFSVCDPYFTNAEGVDLDDIRWGEYEGEKEGIWSDYHFGGKWGSPTPAGVDEDSTEDMREIICSREMESVMEDMFGSDCKVTATRQGFDVEDWSGNHD